jgi:hypothetical protein
MDSFVVGGSGFGVFFDVIPFTAAATTRFRNSDRPPRWADLSTYF